MKRPLTVDAPWLVCELCLGRRRAEPDGLAVWQIFYQICQVVSRAVNFRSDMQTSVARNLASSGTAGKRASSWLGKNQSLRSTLCIRLSGLLKSKIPLRSS
ncbi:uncharacterized protein ACBT57_008981 isoform 1-T2 [Dama dama]